ncbi:hypothetical protein [Vibrio paucivorans]
MRFTDFDKELSEWSVYFILILLGSTWRTISDKNLTVWQRLSIWLARVFAGGLIALLVQYGGNALAWSDDTKFFIAGALAVAGPELLSVIVVMATELKHDPLGTLSKLKKWWKQ